MKYKIICSKCGTPETGESAFRCQRCNSILEVAYDYSTLKLPKGFKKAKIKNTKYLPFLPVKKLTCTLGEGSESLLKPVSFFPNVRLSLKIETNNPTLTFKDNGSAVEITKAKELGFKRVCCASTGNMGISIAHYARKFGIKATIFISKDANAMKLHRIRRENAEIIEVDGDFNKSLNAAEAYAKKEKV